MKYRLKEEQLKATLKSLLKKKGIHYKDLAVEMNCSVPTIKRLLTSGELDFSRLLKLCEILDVSLADLEKLSELERNEVSTVFTLEQEEFFVKNPAYLSFLTELYDGKLPEEIAKKYELTQRSLNLYLVRLEKIGLLRSRNGKYVLVQKDYPNFQKRGPLAKNRLMNIIETVTSFIKGRIWQAVHDEDGKTQSTWVSFGNYKLPEWVFQQWNEKYKSLMMELNSLTKLYESTAGKDTLNSYVLGHMYTTLKPNDPEYDFNFGFAKIENLP